MWLHPEITVTFWAKAGVPIWQTFIYVVLWTSLTLTITYYGVGLAERWLINTGITKEITIKKWRGWWQSRNNNFKTAGPKKRVINWLGRQKNWIILACGFVPFVYGLPAAVIVTVKVLKIRNGLLILFIGNVFRSGIICVSIYQALIKIFF
jgi:hypothetical protein